MMPGVRRPLPILSLFAALALAACGGGDDGGLPGDGGGTGGLVPDDPAAAGWVESSYGLPTIAIWADPADLDLIHEHFDDDIPITAAVQMPEGIWEGVTFELHGGYARTVAKKTYRLVFPDESKPEIDLFGDGEVDGHRRFVLNASWIDPTFARNRLTMDLLRAMGGLAPRLGYRILLLNGEWHGLYVVTERIDKPWLKRQGFDRDGNLYKAENSLANWQAKADALDGYELEINPDNPTDDLGELLDVLTYTPATHEDFQVAVEPALHLDDFLTWQMVHTLAMNADTYTKNYYLYHDLSAVPGSVAARFRIASWDADATWGIAWDGAELEPIEPAWHGTDTFSPRLLSIDSYRADYRARYLAALADELAASSIRTRVASVASKIRAAAAADLAHWERGLDFDAAVERLEEVIDARHELMHEIVTDL